LNEQLPEYWRELFRTHDYVTVDCLRPLFANETKIPAWYRYNLLLYVHRSNLHQIAAFARQFQLSDQEEVPDNSPLLYRLRKGIVRRLPQSLCDQLARWNARRYRHRR
jgi:hypothetical protein